jgi:hypothetical protein
VFLSLDGSPRASNWKPVPVRSVRADDTQECNPSDFPWLGSALVMRRRAVDALRDMVVANGEILPLHTDDDVELYVFNVRAIASFAYRTGPAPRTYPSVLLRR